MKRFGKGEDVQPFSVTKSGHCIVHKENQRFSIEAGSGDTIHNGLKLESGVKKKLVTYDRVVMGTDILLFIGE